MKTWPGTTTKSEYGKRSSVSCDVASSSSCCRCTRWSSCRPAILDASFIDLVIEVKEVWKMRQQRTKKEREDKKTAHKVDDIFQEVDPWKNPTASVWIDDQDSGM